MRLALVTLWMLIGGAIAGGVYWLFLTTPESTVWTLIASASLALIAIVVIALTINGAIAIWANGLSFATVVRAARSIPAILPAALIVWLAWWLTARGETWVTMRSGQINAWFIATFGSADVSWLFRAIHYAALWLRWILAPMLALSLMSGMAAAGSRAMAQGAWLRRALDPRALVLTSLLFAVLIALPWKYVVPWRPAALPPTSIEMAFIVAKLSFTAMLFAIAAALIVRIASGGVPPPRDPKEALIQAA
jgi:hypothetical protein